MWVIIVKTYCSCHVLKILLRIVMRKTAFTKPELTLNEHHEKPAPSVVQVFSFVQPRATRGVALAADNAFGKFPQKL
jgi:hypothetical protein